MRCLHPIEVKRYSRFLQDRDGDGKRRVVVGYMSVPCGKCLACRIRYQNNWAFRILEESKVSATTFFITLTYDDEHLEYTESDFATLVPEHLTLLWKRMRKFCKFRYFSCGEYGDKFGRPHYHACIFFSDVNDAEIFREQLSNQWYYGEVLIEDNITPGRAKYCAKYSCKQHGFDYKDVMPPFARMSRKPALGSAFINDLNRAKIVKTNNFCVFDSAGTPYSIPRFYADRILTDRDKALRMRRLRLELDLQDENELLNFKIASPDAHFFKFKKDTLYQIERQVLKNLKTYLPYKQPVLKERFKQTNDEFKNEDFY